MGALGGMYFGWSCVFGYLMGMIIVFSSDSWGSVWCGLEVMMVMVCFCCIFYSAIDFSGLMKFFIIQSAAGFMVLVAGEFCWGPACLFTALFMKLGVFPFYFWFIEVVASSTWELIFILSTFSKVAGLQLLFSTCETELLAIIGALTIVVGSLGGIQSGSLRVILGYSSLGHTGWMLSMGCSWFWMVYFLVYLSMVLSVIIFLMKSSVNYPSELIFLDGMKMVGLAFFSLAGLPPTLGFSLKWMGLMNLCDMFIVGFGAVVVFSVVSIYYYLRIFYFSFIGVSIKEVGFFLVMHGGGSMLLWSLAEVVD